jgi:hypothetical protein
MRIAVHERARPPAPQLHDVGGAREIHVGDPMERRVHAIAQRFDRHLNEVRAPTAVARAASLQPRQVVAEARRLPIRTVQRRQLFDDVERARLDVRIIRRREAAARGFQVFEHHDIAIVGELGIPRTRHAHRHLGR